MVVGMTVVVLLVCVPCLGEAGGRRARMVGDTRSCSFPRLLLFSPLFLVLVGAGGGGGAWRDLGAYFYVLRMRALWGRLEAVGKEWARLEAVGGRAMGPGSRPSRENEGDGW